MKKTALTITATRTLLQRRVLAQDDHEQRDVDGRGHVQAEELDRQHVDRRQASAPTARGRAVRGRRRCLSSRDLADQRLVQDAQRRDAEDQADVEGESSPRRGRRWSSRRRAAALRTRPRRRSRTGSPPPPCRRCSSWTAQGWLPRRGILCSDMGCSTAIGERADRSVVRPKARRARSDRPAASSRCLRHAGGATQTRVLHCSPSLARKPASVISCRCRISAPSSHLT